MPKFVTIGYGDEAGYRRTPADARAAAHANDDELIRRGALIGMAAAPVQVRNLENRGVDVKDGAYLQSSLPIAGFAVIEATTSPFSAWTIASPPSSPTRLNDWYISSSFTISAPL